jgi:signal transduction histidine kinase/FixJ family two-component response regulator
MAKGGMESFIARWPFLSGGGEMGAQVRDKDWSETPLGAIDDWPQSLRTSVSTCLNSRFAILIWWGPELVMLYNDAYRQILGAKHPAALGMAGRDCWPEVWPIIGPMLEGVTERGEATWSDDLLLLLERHGYPEECYFTFSYSPIRDESGGIGGIFTPVHETTARVIGQRRLETLERLGNISLKGKRVDETCHLAAQAISFNNADVPFAAIYPVDAAGAQANLVAHCGIGVGTTATPASISLRDGAYSELGAAARTGRLEVLPNRDLSLPGGAWPVPPSAIILQPVLAPNQKATKGLLITGQNPRKQLDRDYRVFLELLAQQLGHAIAEAEAFEQERQRAETLAALDRAKTAFFSNVSHEFRTPLTLMLGPLEEILDRPAEHTRPEDRQLLLLVERNALRLQKLVNALLDFSRIEAGRIAAQFEPVDLASFTTELAASFRSAMERAGLTFTVDCPPLRQAVYVDEAMWEKIVLNLLSNALKHTFEGSVTVRLAERGEWVDLAISDTGTGIPEAELRHIFERFRRVDGSRARTHEGTGIGLALVQELARLHGGDVGVTSILNQGSTFTVCVPFGKEHLPADRVKSTLVSEPAPVYAKAYVEEALIWLPQRDEAARIGVARRKEAAREMGMNGPARILLVEDNADMRDYVVRLLEQEYDVMAAANGMEALETAVAEKPDLILSDIMLPKLDGFGLLRELRNRPETRATPVVFLSARAGEEESAEGREAGADDYIVKPFTARELTARLRGTLRIHRERRRATEHMNQIFAQAPVAICVFRGPDFVYELANPSYEDLVRGRQIVGRKLADVIPNLEEEVWAALRRALETGGAVGKKGMARAVRLGWRRRTRRPLVECGLSSVAGPGREHLGRDQCRSRHYSTGAGAQRIGAGQQRTGGICVRCQSRSARAAEDGERVQSTAGAAHWKREP